MFVDQRTHNHTPLRIHITVFVSTPPSTTTPRVTCGFAIAVALPCTMSTICNRWCNIPAERGCDTGDCVQLVDLLHGGVTKQLRPVHGADHNRCKHHAPVRCSSDFLRDLSPFRICSSEVHKAERHTPKRKETENTFHDCINVCSGKCCMFLVSDRHSRHVYNRQPCFELIYVAKGYMRRECVVSLCLEAYST